MQVELKKRLLTAAALITALLVILTAAALLKYPYGSSLLSGVAFLLSVVSAIEYCQFSNQSYLERARSLLLVISPILLSVLMICLTESALISFVFSCATGLVILCWGSIIYARNDLNKFKATFLSDGIAMILIGFGGAALISICFLSEFIKVVVFLVATVAINDSAAYFVGSKLAGPKLAVAFSPKKTIVGSLAGLFAALIFAYIFALLTNINSKSLLVLMSLIMTSAAQAADLLESYLKRTFAVKDSGSILPGHGGIFDRIDAVLGAAPFCLIFFELLI